MNSDIPIYKERGGGWIGDGIFTLQATWPFASLQVTKDTLTLKVGWRTAELDIKDLVAIKRVHLIPFFADGIRLIHKNTELPKLLLFWSFGHGKKIKEILDLLITLSATE